MKHHLIANIDTHMRDAIHIFTHRSLKENQVAGTRFIRSHWLTKAVKPCRTSTACFIHAGKSKHIGNEAGAVEGRFRAMPTPHI